MTPPTPPTPDAERLTEGQLREIDIAKIEANAEATAKWLAREEPSGNKFDDEIDEHMCTAFADRAALIHHIRSLSMAGWRPSKDKIVLTLCEVRCGEPCDWHIQGNFRGKCSCDFRDQINEQADAIVAMFPPAPEVRNE